MTQGTGVSGPWNVVVTGGGTAAPIDDVRSITNASTGRFSAAITEACLDLGANVWHVHAPSAQLPILRHARFDPDADDPGAELARLSALRDRWEMVRDRLHLVPLRNGGVAEYAETLRRVLTDRPVDMAFLAMAVSDFEPEAVRGKIESERPSITIRARRAPKVIQSVRDWSPGVYLVGFKLLSRAEPEELIRAAEAACVANRADLTVANDLESLREGRHTLHLVRPGHPPETIGPGGRNAAELVARVITLMDERSSLEMRESRPVV